MSIATAPIARGPIPRNLHGYEVHAFLGEGAGSLIYAVSDPKSSQIYALKHVVVKTEKEVRFIDQLVTEFEVGTKVSHPLVRRCIDLKVVRTLLRKPTEGALIMEMVEGVTCEVQPPTSIEAAVSVMLQTAQALHAMHQQGYVHCDLKPNNILVGSDGSVKVIDLGQACVIGAVKERIQGTPDFIAPEQVRREPLSPQTDVYNLGATFYCILSGKKLPTLFTLKKTENSFLVADVIPTPRELNPHVPENLSNLVMECVHTTASKRPADMGELASRLEVVQFSLSGTHGAAAELLQAPGEYDSSIAPMPRA